MGLTKPLVKIDINGYGVIKTFQVESQETFHELCLRVADRVMIDPQEAAEYRLFLIDTNKDKDSLHCAHTTFDASFPFTHLLGSFSLVFFLALRQHDNSGVAHPGGPEPVGD